MVAEVGVAGSVGAAAAQRESLAGVAELAVDDEIAALAAHLDAAQHRLLTLIRAFDASEGWYAQGATSCAAWLSWRIGSSQVVAREKVRVARCLGALPLIDAAMERGLLSYSKVRALTRVATPTNEATLLNMARNATAAQLEKICRSMRRVVDPATEDESNAKGPSAEPERDVWLRGEEGSETVMLQARLRPDEAMRVMQAVEGSRELLRAEALQDECGRAGVSAEARSDGAGAVGSTLHATLHATLHPVELGVSAETSGAMGAVPLPDRADALLHLAETFMASHAATAWGAEIARMDGESEESRPKPRCCADRFELIVHMAPSLLEANGYDAFFDDGTRLSGAALRRLACDAALVPVATDERGQPLDVGRKTRTIPPAIRRALHVRDRGACAYPNCNHTRFLDAHHIQHWADGGATKLDNLLLLCSRHHTLLHEGRYDIQRDAQGRLLFCMPNGTRIPSVPRPPRVPGDAAAALQRAHAQQGLSIDPQTSLPQSYTKRPDYNACALAALQPSM